MVLDAEQEAGKQEMMPVGALNKVEMSVVGSSRIFFLFFLGGLYFFHDQILLQLQSAQREGEKHCLLHKAAGTGSLSFMEPF